MNVESQRLPRCQARLAESCRRLGHMSLVHPLAVYILYALPTVCELSSFVIADPTSFSPSPDSCVCTSTPRSTLRQHCSYYRRDPLQSLSRPKYGDLTGIQAVGLTESHKCPWLNPAGFPDHQLEIGMRLLYRGVVARDKLTTYHEYRSMLCRHTASAHRTPEDEGEV